VVSEAGIVDVVVVGGGISGVSIGHELAARHSVAVLDMEAALAYHTTGRSAAMYLQTYGGPTVQALTAASRELLDELAVLTPLAMLYIASSGRGAAIDTLYDDVRPLVPDVVLLSGEEAACRQPLLRSDRVDRALLEPGAMAIDVHALHQHFVRGLRQRGGSVAVRARVCSAERDSGVWTIGCADGRSWRARAVVDAAGAWADEVAALFGGAPIGLNPLRRTAFIVDAPPTLAPPMVADIDGAYYFKPDAGRLLCSPADETPQAPSDARPDELETARAIESINEVTTLRIRHVRSAWAGLRSFVADRMPVVGYDDMVDGLFWYAAQGGYGVQTAGALARVGAALFDGVPLPTQVADLGVNPAVLAPRRSALASPPGLTDDEGASAGSSTPMTGGHL